MEMMGGLAILFGWPLLVVWVSAFTARWALRVWRRQAELRWPAKVAAGLLGLSVACVFFGTLTGVARVLVTFVTEGAEPRQKARALAEAISLEMNTCALGVVVGVPAWTVWLVLPEPKNKPR